MQEEKLARLHVLVAHHPDLGNRRICPEIHEGDKPLALDVPVDEAAREGRRVVLGRGGLELVPLSLRDVQVVEEGGRRLLELRRALDVQVVAAGVCCHHLEERVEDTGTCRSCQHGQAPEPLILGGDVSGDIIPVSGVVIPQKKEHLLATTILLEEEGLSDQVLALVGHLGEFLLGEGLCEVVLCEDVTGLIGHLVEVEGEVELGHERRKRGGGAGW
mmetsp:Transcript_66453/g.158871  ORF Transcript_66453/g.158871 Transcript_66453/m.158871 type:complete len:217 (+) Transcript_66453:635-1285(+)